MHRKTVIKIITVILVIGLIFILLKSFDKEEQTEGFAHSNGRIEAVEIDISTKVSGRVEEILAEEGEFVKSGQVLALMDTGVLEAQLKEARAKHRRSQVDVDTAKSLVNQRVEEKVAAEAFVQQRLAELTAAEKHLNRSRKLVEKNIVSEQTLDDDQAKYNSARAAVSASRANVSAADAAIKEAESRVFAAESAVDESRATIERIQADINDSVLKTPRDGRIQFRVAQPGEVLAAGGVVVNMADLSNVFMTFYLPTSQAGRVAIGTEARIIIDAAPEYVIPANITFVSNVAQFTPKTVETEEERQKLMFKLKARIPEDLLNKHIKQVKTGLPGEIYVRMENDLEWPEKLQVNLPD